MIEMHHNWERSGRWMTQAGWQPGMGCMGARTVMGDMTALKNVSNFDLAFIEEMVPRHQMGVMMAQIVLANSVALDSNNANFFMYLHTIA
jgi:uncharacterized protein (DUF305 family)